MIPLFLIPSSKIYQHFVILVSLSSSRSLSLTLALSLSHMHTHILIFLECFKANPKHCIISPATLLISTSNK